MLRNVKKQTAILLDPPFYKRDKILYTRAAAIVTGPSARSSPRYSFSINRTDVIELIIFIYLTNITYNFVDHRVLVGKPEVKRPLGKPRSRWEDNIKLDVQEVGRGRGDWMELAQDRDGWRALVSTVKNLRVS
jgi:hypothetical protein